MTRYVDDGVELVAGERREAVRLVAVDADQARPVSDRSRDAARRAGHVVPGRAGRARNRASEELRAAENQQAHATIRWWFADIILFPVQR
jgi:hypothetical protein